jgi:hypothetical protein
MDTKLPPSDVDRALAAVGELLAEGGHRLGIVVVGGTAMNLLGIVHRATRDVDVLALASSPGEDESDIRPPTPLPDPLVDAVGAVARDLRLAPDWLNTAVAGQWETGLPPGLGDRIHWRRYDGLDVGLVDRYDLIFLKLYAAVDDVGPTSIHYQDLLAMRPTESDLQAAAVWVRSQDPSAAVSEILGNVIDHAKRDLS